MAFKYEELTSKVIGCAMKVYNKMRSGYKEIIYSRCLAIEFEKTGIKYNREMEWPIYYDGIIVGRKRVDYMIEDTISLELKAIKELTDKELNEGLNYLESHNLEIGLLINFGGPSLEFKRLFNKKYNPDKNSCKPANPINTASNLKFTNPGNLANPLNPGSNPRL